MYRYVLFDYVDISFASFLCIKYLLFCHVNMSFLSMRYLLFYTCKFNDMPLSCLWYLLFHHVDISITCLYYVCGTCFSTMWIFSLLVSITFVVLTFPQCGYFYYRSLLCLGYLLLYHVDVFLQLAEDYPVVLIGVLTFPPCGYFPPACRGPPCVCLP